MRNWRSQFDVAHTVTTNFSLGDFNATLLTNHTTVFQTLIFATKTFVVFYRAKNTRTEQTITLRLERTIVDGFRFFHFTKRP
ncbi:Uncharacterised protein [Vibrio cholerae]|uniref:Uncharacterized protein n=1 Tax=Vibrio cholerae TaxID=666 RepID=A0A656ANX9_VIBCL|nr:Uncharacterised protein [Vibrio cholerae]CSB24821.1 Uncharacterised protein [Vibrio cholerae]CSB40116.1 Uncharacterised protein [Vibrio cholerae]CSC02073.1 Uncharacterised protein [Vibrio cholerae]CSC35011.1 Uncharacterised protein [Vibrio cholerae]